MTTTFEELVERFANLAPGIQIPLEEVPIGTWFHWNGDYILKENEGDEQNIATGTVVRWCGFKNSNPGPFSVGDQLYFPECGVLTRLGNGRWHGDVCEQDHNGGRLMDYFEMPPRQAQAVTITDIQPGTLWRLAENRTVVPVQNTGSGLHAFLIETAGSGWLITDVTNVVPWTNIEGLTRLDEADIPLHFLTTVRALANANAGRLDNAAAVRSLQDDRDTWRERFVADAHEVANTNEWDSDFDQLLQDHGLPRRTRDWDVIIRVEVDIQVTVSAGDSDAAYEEARQRIDLSESEYVTITDRHGTEHEGQINDLQNYDVNES